MGDRTQASFTDELVEAGILVRAGAEGLFGRGAVFESITEGVEAVISRAGVDQDATIIRFPPVMPRWAFRQTSFVESFPQLIGSVHTFGGDDRAHARIRAASEAGEDWTGELVPAEVMLCSSACHPLYPTRTGSVAGAGEIFDVLGYCFRHEASPDPARLQSFRQREYVFLGEPEGARAHRDLWAARASELLSGLGLEVSLEVANDPFFGRAGRLMAENQRGDALKMEVLTQIVNPEGPTAVASSNYHRDHFGSRFDIRLDGGAPAHSACVGFGLERIVLALLNTHGLDTGRWPGGPRSRLWP